MKTNPIITDEMLAAYLAGNATAHETALILRAVETDSTIRETLRILSETEIEEAVDVLPMMAMAADDCEKANHCAIRCEAYVLRKFGVDATIEELVQEAQLQEWLKEEGTPLYNIGRLCEQYDLLASRRYECTIEDIKAALSKGKQVIAVVDTTGDGKPNHSVVVTSLQDDSISIFDPETLAEIDTISIIDFEKQWATSHCYMTIVSDAAIDEYDPHPIDLSDVALDPEMNELREAIAENAHEVWAAARKSQGWSYGPARNDILKQTPDMVPYSRLTDEEKQYDRDLAENTIKLLKKLGWEIKKTETPTKIAQVEESGNLNIEDIVVNQPSFKRIIEDGIITEEEIEEQSQRVVAKIKEIESIATPEVKEKMRELLAEISVLVAISNLKDVETPEEQVYHCSECGHEFHKHDVFCPNPKCGKLITYMDYQDL